MPEFKLNLKALQGADTPPKDDSTSEEVLEAPVNTVKDTSVNPPHEEVSWTENIQIPSTVISQEDNLEENSTQKTEEALQIEDITWDSPIQNEIAEQVNISPINTDKPEEDSNKKKSGIYSFSLPKSKWSIKRAKQKAMQLIEDQKNAAQELKDEAAKPPKEHVEFQNYESSFSKQSGHVIKKLQNFKYTPKTRVGFMIWLLSLTFGTLALLMVVFPEKHSISIYKASIIDLYSDEAIIPIDNISPSNQIDSPETNSPDTEIPKETPEKKVQSQKERLREHLIEKYSK